MMFKKLFNKIFYKEKSKSVSDAMNEFYVHHDFHDTDYQIDKNGNILIPGLLNWPCTFEYMIPEQGENRVRIHVPVNDNPNTELFQKAMKKAYDEVFNKK